MTMYWVMFSVPALLALLPGLTVHGRANPLWVCVMFFLIVAIGLRYEVGGDWLPYWYGFIDAKGAEFSDAVHLYRDPGYRFFNWMLANLGLGIWSLNLLCAAISVSGIMAIAKRQPLPWVALAVAVPYILVVVSMGYTRQATALGLVCWALLAVQDARKLKFLFYAVAAVTFHKSAVVILPLFLLTLPRINLRHWILLGFLLTGILAVAVLQTFEAQWHSYVEKGRESEGTLVRLAMNIPPALVLLIWRKRLGLDGKRDRHWLWFAVMSFVAIIAAPYASTAVDRLALYLLPLQMVVYSRVHKIFDFPPISVSAVLASLAIYSMVLLVWLNYAGHANAWLPYQFYPFASGF